MDICSAFTFSTIFVTVVFGIGLTGNKYLEHRRACFCARTLHQTGLAHQEGRFRARNSYFLNWEDAYYFVTSYTEWLDKNPNDENTAIQGENHRLVPSVPALLCRPGDIRHHQIGQSEEKSKLST